MFAWCSHGFPMFQTTNRIHPVVWKSESQDSLRWGPPLSRCAARVHMPAPGESWLELGAIGRMLRVNMRRPQGGIIMHHLPVVIPKKTKKDLKVVKIVQKKMKLTLFCIVLRVTIAVQNLFDACSCCQCSLCEHEAASKGWKNLTLKINYGTPPNKIGFWLQYTFL